ncbi:hypothetical protein LEN26_016899 [Aphanomyces euteiches]|nr:hypothetical protein LEN26_016899 [Aphanomyces euteiches]KAH9104469.1 hypothetical protein AeMF1_019445 [Aphanomyces euteiches]KAH9189233.1 hypothetical protein AeNC1_008795 [Aphanomyces euteiches]
MADLTEFTTYPANRVVLARGLVLLSTIISFFCCTAVTGASAGDYAFIANFMAIGYTLLHAYFVTYQKSVSFAHMTQLIVDGVLAILLLAGAIAVIAYPWYKIPAAGTVTFIFMFVATLGQVLVIVFQIMGADRSGNQLAATPQDAYVAPTTDVNTGAAAQA